MPIRLVVTDMDGTLYSWVDYIVPAVEAMVTAVCEATGFPRIKVVQSLKEVYERYESNEYPFALQESSIFKEFPEFGSFDKLIIEPARIAFSGARRKYLQPFKGVESTLKELQARKIPVAALTDAPRNPAEQRVRLMKLDQYISAVYSLPGFTFPKGPDGKDLVAPDILRNQERGKYSVACKLVELPREAEKPNTVGLRQILQDFGVEPNEVLLIGDSVKKDIAVARELGVLDAWAEYGTYVSLEYRERLDIISAPAITRRHASSVFEAGHKKALEPTHTLSNFAQVLGILDARA